MWDIYVKYVKGTHIAHLNENINFRRWNIVRFCTLFTIVYVRLIKVIEFT